MSAFRKSPFSNPFLLIATGTALARRAGALYVPAMQMVLRVEPIALDAWIRIVAVAASILVAIEVHKLVRHPRRRHGSLPRAPESQHTAPNRPLPTAETGPHA